MKLSHASSYALHALVHLARSKPDQCVPSHIIAKADGTPERFLLKILKPLVTARILHAVKGPHGGYRLARVPAKISVLEVVEAVDGPLRGEAPAVGMGDAAALDQRLDAECRKVAELVRGQLRKVSIKNLAWKVNEG
jgi:Rrf2 family protein